MGALVSVHKVMFSMLSYHQLSLYMSLSRPSPPFLCLFCLSIRHPHLFYIHPILFPSPLGHPRPQSPLRRQTQVHNGPGHNKICDRVLVSGDIGVHLLQSRLFHRVLQRGVYPHSVPTFPRLPLCQPVGHPVVVSSQHPPNAWYHHSRLGPIKQDRLNHRQVYLAQSPGIIPSLINTCVSRAHFRRDFRRLLTTAVQLLSDAKRTIYRYLKEVTGSRGIP